MFCSLAKILISLAMFNFYFILIKDLEIQYNVLCVFFLQENHTIYFRGLQDIVNKG